MKIRTFNARGIHGYLDVSVDFDETLTFLTGNNGAGKSSVVHSIVALISPSLHILANIQFQVMELTLDHDDVSVKITAKRDGQRIEISTNTSVDAFLYNVYETDPDELPHRAIEKEGDFYKSILTSAGSHPVFELIQQLPTPMFLDLDRRSIAQEDIPAPFRYRRRRERNIFNASLANSLSAAASLAESQYQQLQVGLRQISEETRRALVLSLLSFEAGDFGRIEKPRSSDLATIAELRKASAKVPALLQVKPSDIESRLSPFLKNMEDCARKIPEKMPLHEIMGKRKDGVTDAIIQWSTNLPQLKKISEMIKIVEQHNMESEYASKANEKYLKSVNTFFKDSKKTLKFNEQGFLCYSVEGAIGDKPLSSLSSGEAQIFVILTHLYYNPLAKRANVFIIDEPEISLHVAWQELFVEDTACSKLRALSRTLFFEAAKVIGEIIVRND